MPELAGLGITRVANQTRLDTTGVPCFAAIRPNSRTLAVHQGKGDDDEAAKVSAIMEAAEFAVAEAPTAHATVSSMASLERDGFEYFVPFRALPQDTSLEHTTAMTWLVGNDLVTGGPVYVPLDAAALASNASERLPFSQSSTGLAAGFSVADATAHALCELVERDASTLWSLRSLAHCADTEIAAGSIASPVVRALLGKLRDAGFQVRLYDLTTNLGIPVAMALLRSGPPRYFFDVASGVCAHPSSERALAGAILEAAQTRVSNIAGARDDIDPAEYRRPIPDWIADLVVSDAAAARCPAPSSSCRFAELPRRMGGRVVAVPLSRPDAAVQVVKVLSDAMEDRSTNVHWRPGPRALRALTVL